MAAVQAELAKIGIAKTRTNEQQQYKFRGIDEVYNVIAPLFAQHGLLMIPRITERIVTERISGNNKALFVVTVKAEYDFVAVADGSSHSVGPFYGEAMDSGDKATNKAMSAAHKYAIFETFCVPVQGSPDADADDHDVKAELTAEQTASLTKLRDASLEGIKALETAWAAAGKHNRVALASHLDALKDAAAKAEGDSSAA
jgi:hypothetical protein